MTRSPGTVIFRSRHRRSGCWTLADRATRCRQRERAGKEREECQPLAVPAQHGPDAEPRVPPRPTPVRRMLGPKHTGWAFCFPARNVNFHAELNQRQHSRIPLRTECFVASPQRVWRGGVIGMAVPRPPAACRSLAGCTILLSVTASLHPFLLLL